MLDVSFDDLNRKAARMQKYLKPLRLAAGYSGDDVAKLLGVTRITYATLEKSNTTMRLGQYFSFRYIFENLLPADYADAFQKLMRLLVDREDISDEYRWKVAHEILTKVKLNRKLGTAAMTEDIRSYVMEGAANGIF